MWCDCYSVIWFILNVRFVTDESTKHVVVTPTFSQTKHFSRENTIGNTQNNVTPILTLLGGAAASRTQERSKRKNKGLCVSDSNWKNTKV